MEVAVIPQYTDALGDDELFAFDTYDPTLAYGVDRPAFAAVRERFEAAGDEIHTADLVEVRDMDAVVFIDMSFRHLDDLLELDDPPALVYVMREPPSVRTYNASAQLVRYRGVFDQILTWNDSLSAIGDPFVDYAIAQLLPDQPVPADELPGYDERDLLVNVTSRKYSSHPEELYTAREAVIQHFDDHAPDEFTLYGLYWNDRHRLEDVYHHGKLRSHTYRTYGGLIDEKGDAYRTHRFGLCFENVTGIDGYLTEKLFDCLRSGAVPVYWGAENVDEYVPTDAFVDYREFGSPAALREHLVSMDEAEWHDMLRAGREFLRSGAEAHAPGTYAETMYGAVADAVESGSSPVLSESLRAEIMARGTLDRFDERPESVDRTAVPGQLWGVASVNPRLLVKYPKATAQALRRLVPV